jgi:Dolichyl-phosphate-mannose-protein mannosyltransferase
MTRPEPSGFAQRVLWGRWAFAWLLLTLVVLRAPSAFVPLVNLDECDFWLFGRMMREHAVPYVGVADIKPPLTYVVFLLADLTGLPRTWSVPLLGAGAVLATALLLCATARRWSGEARVGWAAAWLALVAGLCESPSTNAEILMNVPAAGALYLFLRAEQDRQLRWDVLSGVAAGMATLFKCQGGILLVALGMAASVPALRRAAPGGRLRPLARGACMALGFAAPWAATVGLFAVSGHLDGFLDWVVRRNLFQISTARVFSLANVLPSIAAALGAAAFAWWMALGQVRRSIDGFGRALTSLLALTWLSVAIGGRFYEHYFLQFVPPLALLGAPGLVRLVEDWDVLSRVRRGVSVALALLPPLGYLAFVAVRGMVGGYPGQDPKAAAVAAWLAANTAPTDRVFMWGDYSAIYCLADRLPGTRYMRTAPHVGDFDPLHLPPGFDFTPYRSRRDIAFTLQDLDANRPEIVLDTSPADIHRWSLFPLDRVDELRRYVDAHYQRVASPAGAAVYRLRERAPGPGSSAVAGAAGSGRTR